MIICNNILGLNAFKELSKNERKTTGSLEKLSSGLRINNAADDAAGLSISERMRAQIRGLAQAARNIQDGISYMDTAEGYLSSIHTPPLQRLRELAVQAANDTLNKRDREAIQEEVLQIQEHLKKIFSSAEFNTIDIFAQDIKRIKTPIPGVLPGDTVIRQYGLNVVAGKNDRLTFRWGDAQYEITLEAGNYTAEQLVDKLNDKFKTAGTDVTVQFEGDSLVYSSPTKLLDSFGGSMIAIDSPLAYTSIIYDNSKPGYISGAAIFGAENISDGVIIDSSHNALAFRIGSNGVYTDVALTLADSTYTEQGILDALNGYFADNNIDATATTVSGRLKLQHNKCGAGYTLDQLSGTARSVILDQLTSYTYNETIVGGSDGYAAAITGYKSLAAGITIEAGHNDTLRLNVGGTTYTVTLSSGTYTQAGILDHLNDVFGSNGITATAKASGTALRLEYTGPGAGEIGTVTGGAAYTLMGLAGSGPAIYPGTYYFVEGNSTPLAGNHATAIGQTSLSNGVQIVAGYNDTLTFNLDGEAKTITLGAGWYNANALLSAINTGLTGMDVTAQYYGSNQLEFEHKKAGGGIPLFPYSLNNFGGNALSTLMSTTMPVSQYSGAAASPCHVYGAATVTNVTISAGVNDALTVRVNNADHSIVLDAKTYTQADLVAEINKKLSNEGIGSDIVASQYSSYLELHSKTTGTTTTINSVSGNSVNTLFRNVQQYYTYASLITPSASDTYIDGRADLNGGVIIAAGTNDKLAFDLHNDGVIERKTITLDEGEYTADSLVSMINEKLQAQNLLMSAALKSVSTPSGDKSVLTLTYSPGKNGNFAIDGVGGSASYVVFYPGPYDITYKGGVALNFHVGANSGNKLASGTQLLMNLEILGIERLDLTTRSGADQAIQAVDDAINMVSSARGLTGAIRNELEAIYRNVTQSGENLQAAESLIRDANVAKEMVEYAKISVLSQASNAILAQANKQSEMILELLK